MTPESRWNSTMRRTRKFTPYAWGLLLASMPFWPSIHDQFSPALKATGTHNIFIAPGTVDPNRTLRNEKVFPRINGGIRYHIPALTPAQDSQAFEHLTNYASDLRDIRGLWVLNLENDGRKRISGALLRVPGAQLIQWSRDTDTLTSFATGAAAQIGAISPGEKLLVFAWTDSPGAFFNEEVTLVHDDGRGAVTVYEPVDTAGQFVHLLVKLPLFAKLLIVLGVMWGVVSYREAAAAQRRVSTPR